MNPLKVYLQYPWKLPDSPYYKYLVENPPKGIEYLNAEKQKGAITNYKKFWFSNFLKRNIRRSLNSLNLCIPNAHKSPKGNYDLIHCAHCLSKNKDKPWVADFEGVWQFWAGKKNKKTKEKIKKIILRENCKKIMPWTEKTKEEIIKEFPEIKKKIEVVYPAVPIKKVFKKRTPPHKIKIIYAARYFWIKGGLIALEALSKLSKKYNLEILFIANVPDFLKERYPNLEIVNTLPQKKFLEELSTSDIFFYPSLLDTFGFSLLEAMSFGVPPIAVSCAGTKSCEEIIKDGYTGLIVAAPYYHGNDIYEKCKRIGKEEKKIINELIKKTSQLIENKTQRDRISKNCIEEIKNGKFSIKERNKKLKRIYGEALK